MPSQSSMSYGEASSQQASELSESWSFLHNDTARPPRTATPPPNLVQSSKPGFLRYGEETSEEFQDWWKTTRWAIKHLPEMKRKNVLLWDNAVRSSDVWSSFEQVASAIDGEPKMICLQCGQVMVHPTMVNGGTSSMKRHLERKACRSRKQSKDKGQSSLVSAFGKKGSITVSTKPASFTVDAFEQQLLTTILALNWSFRSVEHPQFRRLISLLRSETKVPGRTKIGKLLKNRYEGVRKSALDGLEPQTKVSIALDCWTSPNNLAFMGVTGYFIDEDWNYREVLLGFKGLEGAHSGENLASYVIDILESWELEHRLLAVTADNAYNNQTLRKHLSKLLKRRGIDWDYQQNTVNCMAHVIQLAVNKLLEGLKAEASNEEIIETFDPATLATISTESVSFGNTLKKIRTLAVAINRVPQRLEQFKRLQEVSIAKAVGMIQDVMTRWNSTHDMLVRAIERKSELREWTEAQGQSMSMLKISHKEWEQVKYIVKLLEPFKTFTNALGSTAEPTINKAWLVYNDLFDHLEDQRQKVSTCGLPFTSQLGIAIKGASEKLSQYYGKMTGNRGTLYNLGSVLDPSIKLSIYQGAAWEPEHQSHYEREFRSYYRKHYQHLEAQPAVQSNKTATTSAHLSLGAAVRLRQQSSGKKPETAGSEVTAWLQTAVVEDHNILDEWKLRQKSKPAMAQFAKDILAIPVAGVGVERLFNMARDVCHYRRNRLNAETIQRIMLIKHHDFHSYASDSEPSAKTSTALDLERELPPVDELPDDRECQPTIILSDEEETSDAYLDVDDPGGHESLEESVRIGSDLEDDDLFGPGANAATTQPSSAVQSTINESASLEPTTTTSSSVEQCTTEAFTSDQPFTKPSRAQRLLRTYSTTPDISRGRLPILIGTVTTPQGLTPTRYKDPGEANQESDSDEPRVRKRSRLRS